MYQTKKFNKCEFLKRTLQFVLSVSVFHFFVWYSTGFSILPEQSFNAYFFSTCLFSMLTRNTLQRKYMFLICNVILAFLAKTSLFTSSSPPISANFDIQFQASNLPETEELVSEEAVESPENASLIVVEEEEEEEVEGKDEEGGTGSGVMVVTQDDELAETTMVTTNEELANTDELNRKFEEFIRKMKEEIRIQAQTHPIAV